MEPRCCSCRHASLKPSSEEVFFASDNRALDGRSGRSSPESSSESSLTIACLVRCLLDVPSALPDSLLSSSASESLASCATLASHAFRDATLIRAMPTVHCPSSSPTSASAPSPFASS
eukprot:scaffold2489_cov259-Pinguiococcus_pyrenoidosus.AAC.5